MLEEDFEEYTEDYLNSNFDGEYSCSLDVDMERDEIIMSVASTLSSERPRFGKIVDDLIEEAEIDSPELKIDYQPAEGTYDVVLGEKSENSKNAP